MSKFFKTCNENSSNNVNSNILKVTDLLNALYRLSDISDKHVLEHILQNVVLTGPNSKVTFGNIEKILQNTHQSFYFSGKLFARHIGQSNIKDNTTFDIEFTEHRSCKISFNVFYTEYLHTYKCEIFIDIINLKNFIETHSITQNTVRSLICFAYFRNLLEKA